MMVTVANTEHLTDGTRGQYGRAFRWLQREYHGTYERMEPIQEFIDHHPKCKGIRGRIIQCLINRHLQPRPSGPAIHIYRLRAAKSKCNPMKVLGRTQLSVWGAYLPPRLRAELMANLDTVWQTWLHTYIVKVMGATPIKKNLVRSYVTQVYRVLYQTLSCHTLDDVFALSRHNLAQAVLDVNPHHIHQRRLCRIAVNHFLGGVVLCDHIVIGQRLHLRSRDIPRCSTAGDEDNHPADVALNVGMHVRDHFTQAKMDALLGPGCILSCKICSPRGWLTFPCVTGSCYKSWQKPVCGDAPSAGFWWRAFLIG